MISHPLTVISCLLTEPQVCPGNPICPGNGPRDPLPTLAICPFAAARNGIPTRWDRPPAGAGCPSTLHLTGTKRPQIARLSWVLRTPAPATQVYQRLSGDRAGAVDTDVGSAAANRPKSVPTNWGWAVMAGSSDGAPADSRALATKRGVGGGSCSPGCWRASWWRWWRPGVLLPPPVRPSRLWSKSIKHTPVPKAGCFHASYPAVTWQKVHCAPLLHPRGHENPPHGSRARGALWTTSAGERRRRGRGRSRRRLLRRGPKRHDHQCDRIVSERERRSNRGRRGHGRKFGLQINSNTFSGPPECGTIAGCEGWEQFVYSSSWNQVFIEFWLLNHQKPKEGNKCPSGWKWLGPAKKAEEEYLEADCNLKSELTTLTGGPLKVSGLAGSTLEGRANSGGLDSVVLITGSGSAVASGAASELDLDNGWKIAEFAVLGDFNGTKRTSVRTRR